MILISVVERLAGWILGLLAFGVSAFVTGVLILAVVCAACLIAGVPL